MKTHLVPLLATLVLAAPVQAEVPVYRDQQLFIPGGVVAAAAGDEYYGDIRLDANPDGSFVLAEAYPRKLAAVDLVEVAIQESFPVQVVVTVTGDLSVACVDLEQPGVYRDGDSFHVVLAETPLDPLILCAQVLASYEVDVPLDVYGLEAGEYTVKVNDVETTFTLDADNF